MSYLKKRVIQEGRVLEGNVLRVDSFLNHQIDPVVIREVQKEFSAYFRHKPITKIVTIEASGIAPALMVAADFGVPMVFAKKAMPSAISHTGKYATQVHSYTKNTTYDVLISKEYISPDDHVLVIDDFLANGAAAMGLVNLVEQAGASVSGVGICIEKAFQPGREILQAHGLDVFSICRIASLDNQKVTFVEDVVDAKTETI